MWRWEVALLRQTPCMCAGMIGFNCKHMSVSLQTIIKREWTLIRHNGCARIIVWRIRVMSTLATLNFFGTWNSKLSSAVIWINVYPEITSHWKMSKFNSVQTFQISAASWKIDKYGSWENPGLILLNCNCSLQRVITFHYHTLLKGHMRLIEPMRL